MVLKTLREQTQDGRRTGWIGFRRKPPVRHGGPAPQPRLWSLLLPPRYPDDRR